MKRVFFSAIALVLILGSTISAAKGKGNASKGDNTECTMAEENKEKTICKGETKGVVVEVIYFHQDQRSESCLETERLTREVVNSKFSKELKDRKLQLSIIDISTPEGAKVADIYEVSQPSLFINKWEGNKEHCNNLTDPCLMMVQSNPEEFKLQIEAQLARLLK